MASLNKVFLVGNLTRDPELRFTPNGSAVCEFGMAMNRVYTSNNEKKEEVCFVDVNVWGRQAEACDKYLKKGDPLLVEGRLQLDQWTDKETQKPRSKMRVVAERTQFLGSAGRSNDNEQNNSYPRARQQQPDVNQGQQPYAPPEPTTAPAQPPQASNAGFGGQQQFPAPPPTAPPTQAAPRSFQTQQQPPPQTAQSTEAFNPKVEGSEDDIPF